MCKYLIFMCIVQYKLKGAIARPELNRTLTVPAPPDSSTLAQTIADAAASDHIPAKPPDAAACCSPCAKPARTPEKPCPTRTSCGRAPPWPEWKPPQSTPKPRRHE